MIELRQITDIDLLMQWRREVITTVFSTDPTPRLLEANRDYYLSHIAAGLHLAVIATFQGVDAGCGSVCFSTELPSPDNASGRCAYLMNIYVRPPFRQRGIARSIVSRLISESLQRGCGKIYLEATDEAKNLYRNLGFLEMKNMMKYDPDHI